MVNRYYRQCFHCERICTELNFLFKYNYSSFFLTVEDGRKTGRESGSRMKMWSLTLMKNLQIFHRLTFCVDVLLDQTQNKMFYKIITFIFSRSDIVFIGLWISYIINI